MKVWFNTTQMHAMSGFRGIGVYAMQLASALNHYIPQLELTDQDPELIHYPFFDLFFHTLPLWNTRLPRVPRVVTIHDVIPLIFPDHYRPGLKGSLKFVQQLLSIHRTEAVITDSECSKGDIITYLKVPSERIVVVPLAANPALQPQSNAIVSRVRKKYRLPSVYALYVGDMNYNKNLPRLVFAMSNLPKTVHLVMVGRTLRNTRVPEGKALHDAIETSHMQNRTHLLTDVPGHPATDLAAIYTAAAAYIQPSLYEGFGLPVLDAFRCGTVVASSNAASLPEVYGDAAIPFDPYDEHAMSEAIRHALEVSGTEREQLGRNMQAQEKRFSWKTTAEKTFAVYQRALQG